MKKNIWIINHYATNVFFDKSGRHFWIAKYLKEKGYRPIIICSSFMHNSDVKIDTKDQNFITKIMDGIDFVFIKTTPYKGNKIRRIINILEFYFRVISTSKSFYKEYHVPDIILASSVHPLALVAGLKIAKRWNIPCICEVRDLWPESIVAYGILKRENILTKLMYAGEKYIYEKASNIIMTWEGGSQYILDHGWDKTVNIKKVYYISNGVDLISFDNNAKTYMIDDEDLKDKLSIKIIYAGSIRKVNNLGILVETAKILKSRSIDAKFLIYGAGDEVPLLVKECNSNHLDNVIFKGRVNKEFIPFILSQADINVLHNSSTILDKYGQSQNKLFEYLAAGKMILQTYTTGYSICKKYDCGVEVEVQTAINIANRIEQIIKSKDYIRGGENARKAALNFDFKKLTDKLIEVIES